MSDPVISTLNGADKTLRYSMYIVYCTCGTHYRRTQLYDKSGKSWHINRKKTQSRRVPEDKCVSAAVTVNVYCTGRKYCFSQKHKKRQHNKVCVSHAW